MTLYWNGKGEVRPGIVVESPQREGFAGKADLERIARWRASRQAANIIRIHARKG